jgi:hypothetical protein
VESGVGVRTIEGSVEWGRQAGRPTEGGVTMSVRSIAVGVAVLGLVVGAGFAGPWAPRLATAQADVAPQPPPPPQVESPGKPPSPNAVWISGHWLWRNGKYEWAAGRWENAPPGASYVPGRHKKTDGGWRWEEGRWVQR